MDVSLALRLDSQSPHYDSALYGRLAKLGGDYVRNGLQALNTYLPEFDAAYDVANAQAALPEGTTNAQFDKLDRSGSRNFSHPCGATQIEVLSTAISQILFGGETNRRVEPRNDDDETRAEAVNQLLAWNDQQNDAYATGFDWVKDCLTVNRGIFYDAWAHLYVTEKVPVDYTIPFVPEIDPQTRKKTKPPADHQPKKITRWKTVRKQIGGFSKLTVISPYDFICDPALPIKRMQEGRYAGHRVVLTWQELERRSKLEIDDYEYVLPEVVKKLKNAKARKGLTGIGSASTTSTSRSYWDRQRRGTVTPDLGTTEKANKDDGGIVECWLIIVRAIPKTHGIYEDDEPELIEFLIAGETDLLSANVKTNAHGQYPYAVGEARPGAHQQFSPGWALLLKPTQDMIDILKSAHAEQTERCGSLFLADGTKCDAAAVLTDKTRVRQLVLKTEEASGTPNELILQQIQMQDPTKDFPNEMAFWEGVMEKTSGAHAQVQGDIENPSQTATQWDGTQEMAMGRLSTMARNLSSRALMPQTRRIVSDIQQFMPDEIKVRVVGDNSEQYDPDAPDEKFMSIRREPLTPEERQAMEGDSPEAAKQKLAAGQTPIPRDPRLGDDPVTAQEKISRGEIPIPEAPELNAPDIQCEFDVSPSDGSMPGVDAKAVAAAARLIEASGNPAFANCFNPTIPGNLDPKALLVFVAKKAGLPIKNFLISRKTAQQNLMEAQQAGGMGIAQQTDQPQLPPQPGAGQPMPPIDPQTGQPSAVALPPTPTAAPPQLQGGNISPLTL